MFLLKSEADAILKFEVIITKSGIKITINPWWIIFIGSLLILPNSCFWKIVVFGRTIETRSFQTVWGFSRKTKFYIILRLKNTYREVAPLNKTRTLSKSANMNIWVVGTANQLFYEVLKLRQNFRKTKLVTVKTWFFVIGSFCTPHSICLTIGSWWNRFVWKCWVFNLSTFN